jgi:hypothetical protein
MDPITNDRVEDLAQKRERLEGIYPKNDKLRILLAKKIDNLKRREKCYNFFETQHK